MTGALLDLAPGMADPVLGAQACFRVLLQAMARPGRVLELPPAAIGAIGTPPDRQGRPLGVGLAALLLTLLDAETTVAWHGRLASGAARAWLRFHTGAREAADGAAPDFTLVQADELQPAHWQAIGHGSDEAPQIGGTLIVETPALSAWAPGGRPGDGIAAERRLALQGPGIEKVHRLLVAGLPDAFWHQRIGMPATFPRGFELVLVCGHRLAALPRTTRLALED